MLRCVDGVVPNGIYQIEAVSAVRKTIPNSAVVMMYHRFGESGYPSTNVTVEQFAELSGRGRRVAAHRP